MEDIWCAPYDIGGSDEQQMLDVHVFMIQNTADVLPIKQQVLSFVNEKMKQLGKGHVNTGFDFKLFGEHPYQPVLSQIENKTENTDEVKIIGIDADEWGRDLEECVFVQTDSKIEDAVNGEVDETMDRIIIEEDGWSNSIVDYESNSVKGEDHVFPLVHTLETALDGTCHSEYTAGLESLLNMLGPVEGNPKPFQQMNSGWTKYHIHWLGRGLDTMGNKTEVLARLVECEKKETHFVSFYKYDEDGFIQYAGQGYKGACTMFGLSEEDVMLAKDHLADYWGAYKTEWTKEKWLLQIHTYEKYKNQCSDARERLIEILEGTGKDKLTKVHSKDFEVEGISYQDWSDFMDTETLSWEDYNFPIPTNRPDWWLKKNHKGQILLVKNESYPCFDSYDYANENRYYETVVVCKDIKQAYMKHQILQHNSYNHQWVRALGTVLYYDSGYDEVKTRPVSGNYDNILEAAVDWCRIIEDLQKNMPQSPYHNW